MKIGILTSSRADFGIYHPLLIKLWEDNYFSCEIIAFGTHLEEKYGLTINDIIKSGFEVKHRIKTTPKGDSPANISESIGKTIVKFSGFWEANNFDLIIALGDRYEMFAAVASTSAFNLNIAHIHAGETTLGAIDNSYRHSISLMSNYLFVTTEGYKNRSIEITHNQTNVFNVGALSIDNLTQTKLFSISDFYHKFKIDLNIPTILSTFHPETVSYKKNEIYISELIAAFKKLTKDYQIIITMPNADTMGMMIRSKIEEYTKDESRVILIESFGMMGYLSCMKHCKFLLGNTSSGFVEAAYFPKWVINLGSRQDGRILTPNIVNCDINEGEILQATHKITNKSIIGETNIYGKGNAAEKIIDQLKNISL